jgi:histidinol-phosphate aminotransferase
MKLKLKPWINDLPGYVAGRTIEEIKKEFKLNEVYKMASNENILGPCSQVSQYLKDNLNDINYYPDSDAANIREAIASKYGIESGNVIMGNGTDQIIEMICDCFIREGDNIVNADPNFIIYEKAALKCGGQALKVALKKEGFSQDAKAIVNAVDDRTRIIFLASPHNPTGTILTENDLIFILNNTPDDVLMVIDEAYYEYLEDSFRIDTIKYIKEYPNLISLRTFSKIYGLAGLRIGYGIADPELIASLNKIRLPFNTSLIAQKAAAVAIENDQYIEDIRRGIADEKNKFYRFLDGANMEYIKSHANFILIRTGSKSADIVKKLLESGFIVRPGANLGFIEYIRVTISVPDVNEKFIKKFSEILNCF